MATYHAFQSLITHMSGGIPATGRDATVASSCQARDRSAMKFGPAEPSPVMLS
jgi:hypothetical protein